ncbi:MAG: hypothetical protein U0R26_07745 [Solirubrobacterales bacterium]
MTATTAEPIPRPGPEGPSLKARIAAAAVIVALAVLAAYAVFAGPTWISVQVQSKAPGHAVQPAGQREPEGVGAGNGG